MQRPAACMSEANNLAKQQFRLQTGQDYGWQIEQTRRTRELRNSDCELLQGPYSSVKTKVDI